MELIAHGVWQLSGFPRHLLNVYLIEDVLIDAGTRWSRRRLLRQLADRPPRLVALTHCHPDHQGSAHAICSAFGAPLACHELEAAAVEGREPMPPANWFGRLGARLLGGPACPVGRLLRDGDEVAGFRVVHTPGHTPGHVLFFREADRVAIVGDVLANLNYLTGRAGLHELPSFLTADLTRSRQSIQVLAGLRPSVACFGHGPPLREPELLEAFASRYLPVPVPAPAPIVT
jgi:hydroxyacylglutathione hydrolase